MTIGLPWQGGEKLTVLIFHLAKKQGGESNLTTTGGSFPEFLFFFLFLFSRPGFQRLRKGRVTSAGLAYHAIPQSYQVG